MPEPLAGAGIINDSEGAEMVFPINRGADWLNKACCALFNSAFLRRACREIRCFFRWRDSSTIGLESVSVEVVATWIGGGVSEIPGPGVSFFCVKMVGFMIIKKTEGNGCEPPGRKVDWPLEAVAPDSFACHEERRHGCNIDGGFSRGGTQ